MIYQLNKHDYEKVHPLFAGLAEYSCTVDGVLDSTRTGKIYVDDTDNPLSAFMYSGEWYYLAGKTDNADFNRALNTLIMSDEFAEDPCRGTDDEVFFTCDSGDWSERFVTICGDRQIIEAPRKRYVFKEAPFDWRERIPDGFTFRPLDKDLLESDLKNVEEVHEWMKADWANAVDVYKQRGVGMCAIHGDEIASWCFTASIGGNACEMGIETSPDYQRQGLGTLTAVAAADACLQAGFTVIDWNCNKINLGSWGVAEKAGFVLEREYTAYTYIFDAVIHFAVGGNILFRSKQYKKATEWYEKSISAGDASFKIYYIAARSHAANGDSDNAIKHLNAAIDKGWEHLESTKSCEEFNILHGTPEWEAVLTRITKNLEKNDSG